MALHPPRASIWPDESLPTPGERGNPYSLDRRRAHPSAMIFSAPHTDRSLNGSSRRTQSLISQPRRRIPRQSIRPLELRREEWLRRTISPPLLLLAYLGRFGILLELLMKLRDGWTIKRARQFEMFMHGLVVTHRLLKIKCILLVHLGSKRGVGFLHALPSRALVIQ